MMLEADPNAPYATAARIYAEAGWHGVLPLPERKKANPPDGYTGREGAYPDITQIEQWVQRRGTGNIGLRLNPATVGIDVDDYDGKGGGDTFKALRLAYGELPPTWTSTSRRDGTSGIRLYRLPEAAVLNDKPGPGIEIIQRHHRYVVCWPSIHPDTGDEYYWITPDGEISDRPPRPDELPELPAEWFDGLQAPKRRNVETLPLNGQAGTRWTPAVEQAFGRAMAEMSGGRHDATLHGCAGLVRLNSLGYPGADDALRRLETAFMAAVTGDGTRSDKDAAGEWRRMLVGAEQLVGSTASMIRPYAELIAERRDNDHPVVTAPAGRHSVKDKLEPAELAEPQWDGDPTPLGSISDNLPEFPTGVYPAWVETQVLGVAEELQVPVDLPAMLVLGALSTIAAGHVKVAINGTWEEPVNLYLVTAMPPGAGKSPAAKKMLRPVQEYETELIENARPAASRFEQEQRIREKAMKRAEDLGDKATASALLLEQEMAEPVTIPQLTVDDATHSALVQMLDENHGRAAILSTEGGLFDQLANSRYSDALESELQVYLKGFSGDSHKDRRVGRKATNIPEVTLTISLTVQPKVLEKLSATPELAGVGLTARFMYSIPPDFVGWRNFVEARPTDPTVTERYRQHMLDLARQLGRHEAPMRLRLTPEAADLFLRWHQDMEPRKRNKGDLRVVAEWSEKLRSCVVRVAALLHLADGHDWDDIDVDTLQRAMQVAEYWLEHAKAVHDLWSGNPASSTAKRVVDWLTENRRETFKARDCYKALKLTRDQAKPILELLEDHGWICQVGGSWGRGGQTGVIYAVHPLGTLGDTGGHSPPEGQKRPNRGGVPAVSPVSRGHHPTDDTQVGPAEDTETQRDDVLRPKVPSVLKDILNNSLSLSESAQTRIPRDTGDTGTPNLDGPRSDSPDESIDNDPRPPLSACPTCGEQHPDGMCPAEL